MDHKLVVFSFFSGSGFLDLGFEKKGFDIDFVNEFSQSFLNAYIHTRKKMKLHIPKYGFHNTDINEYFGERRMELMDYISRANKESSLVGFIGGPPCPDFSVGGKNRGRDGENGKLSQTYVNLILDMKPDFFLFENVKGLWRTEKHRAFYEELKEKLHGAGYCTTERLTNALEFGVPQDRDRIFLVGINKGILNKDYYKGNQLQEFPWANHIKYNIDEVKNLVWPDTNLFKEDSYLDKDDRTPKELTVQYWFDKNDVENHPNSDFYFKPRSGLPKMKIIYEGDVGKKSYKRLHRWRYSPTVAYGNNEVHLHPYKVRRISVAEALAIQSLPKEFELPSNMSLTDMFKTTGNGVPFLLSEAVAEAIKDYLEVAVYKKQQIG